jgi:hypothetical protein
MMQSNSHPETGLSIRNYPAVRVMVALILLALVGLQLACSPQPGEASSPTPSSADTSAPTLTLTDIPTPTNTPTPTSTPVPTNTPTPTSISVPTNTPIPGITPAGPPPTPASVLPLDPHAENVDVIGHIGGTVSAVVAQGHYVYAGIGSELAVLDISIPEQPERVGYVVLPGLVKNIVVSGDYAYVVDGNLHVVDVSDPTAPVKVGSLNTQSRSQDIALNALVADTGQQVTIYVVDSECTYPRDCQGRMRVIDVSDPATPYESGGWDIPIEVLDLAVAGTTVYIATAEGLWAMDVSDPTAPERTALHETTWRVIGVETRDDHAYIVVENEGLWVLDTSDPTHPTEIGTYALGDHCLGFVHEDYRMVIAGDALYLSGCVWLEGVRVLDISDPANPFEAGFYALPDTKYEGGSAGVAVVDVSSIRDDPSASTPDSPGRIYAYVSNGTDVDGRQGWSYGGISIVDMSDPAQPVAVGSYDAPASVWDVGVTEDPAQGKAYAFVATQGDGLHVVDVSDPTAPRQIGSLGIFGATDVFVRGTYAYVAAQSSCSMFWWICSGRVLSVDFSTPSAPVMVSAYDPPGGFPDMVMAGSYLYLLSHFPAVPEGPGDTDDEHGWRVRVVDISDPAALTEVGTYDLAESVEITGIAIRDRYLHLGAGGLLSLCFCDVQLGGDRHLVLDVSDPTSPTRIGLYDDASDPAVPAGARCPGEPEVVSGNYAYVVDDRGLEIRDISDPTTPSVVGFYLTPRYARCGDTRNVELASDPLSDSGQVLAYVTDELGGLYILRFTPPAK